MKNISEIIYECFINVADLQETYRYITFNVELVGVGIIRHDLQIGIIFNFFNQLKIHSIDDKINANASLISPSKNKIEIILFKTNLGVNLLPSISLN